MPPEIVRSVFGKKEELLRAIALTTVRINTRNASVFWDSARNLLRFETGEDLGRYSQDEERRRWVHLKDSSVGSALLIKGVAL